MSVQTSFHAPLRPALAMCLALAAVPARGQGITGLGFLPDGSRSWSWSLAIAGQGPVVVGDAVDQSGLWRAFQWTNGTPMQSLGTLGGPSSDSHATAISSDGDAVAGWYTTGIAPHTGPRAFRWSNGGMEDIGTLPGTAGAYANAISRDGSVVVGYATDDTGSVLRPFRWSLAAGGGAAMVDIGTLAGGSYAYAYGVSSDGAVVVGSGQSNEGDRAFRWTAAGGMQNLGAPAGADFSYGYAVSGDGSVVVGQSGPVSSVTAFRWSAQDGMRNLGALGNDVWSTATAASQDGSAVVGVSSSPVLGDRAFLWTAGLGLVQLDAYLPSVGIDLSGWALMEADSISADGLAIVGLGLHNGLQEAYLVILPTPPRCGSADFNCDGHIDTDSDISAFFACLSGVCPSSPCTSTADFDGDGNVGTDADIEAFFRVLAGGSC